MTEKTLFKTTLTIVGLTIALLVVAFSAANLLTGDLIPSVGASSSGQDYVSTANTGEVQNVKLSMQGYTYIMEPSTLKLGVPVRMEVDLTTVTGCMRSINIPAFNVRANVNSGNNIIEFTPTKAGTFNMACSMNMGKGTFNVAGADGKASNYVEPKTTVKSNSGSSCAMGSSGGGCGCGMMG